MYCVPSGSLQESGAEGVHPIWNRVVMVAPMGPRTGDHLWVDERYLVMALGQAARMVAWSGARSH